jgi:HD-GYP domain-containing protein (c-di-GMP phosphodiesterase class II)
MNFYMCLVILAELVMLALTLHVFHYSGFVKSQRVWYIMTVLSIMFCTAAEFAVHCGWYSPELKIPLTVITVLQFSVAPILSVLFSGSLGMPHQRTVAFIFFGINLTVQTVSAPFGWIFYFNEEGYFRGDHFIIYSVFYIISLIYLVINMIIVGKRFHHRDFRTIIMILVVLVAGIIPMTLFQLNVTYIAIAIGASLCYIYYNDLVQQDIQAELVANQKRISGMQEHMISGLASVIENRDMDTGEHISRTSMYVKTLAECARADGIYKDILTDRFILLMYTLAPMHDIGKIIIPDSILKKPGPLTEEEYEQMKQHAAVGGSVVREVLSGISDEEYLSFASDIATYHHERWDGTGYPKGLKGEEIPLSARIMAIADVFDALVSERCYKEAMSFEEAFVVISGESGSHFDPLLADVFLRHRDKFEVGEKITERKTKK